MKTREIVKAWLIANGYDGLCGENCGCKITDLMPCDSADVSQCVAGYLHKRGPKCVNPDCEYVDDGCTFCIRSEKP
ncbi:hypothetical protein LCGC14_0362380 [marine sediment metagenome]|uniref:Uncharacterized protein n=1 Tax=marine sediment metagenome TaxID=412755 RepID=A0A0F9T7V7_9ZZZZ